MSPRLRLSSAAARIAREESAGSETRARLRAALAVAENVTNPERAWRALPENQRRALICYLLDDLADDEENEPANTVCLAMLLRAERGERP